MTHDFGTAMLVVDLAWRWAWVGLAVCVPFLAWGIDRVEANARGAYVFRVMLIPGIVLLWPVVLWRWAVVETGRDDWRARHAPPRRAHGRIWGALALILPALLIAALVLRQNGPLERPAEQLEPPTAARNLP